MPSIGNSVFGDWKEGETASKCLALTALLALAAFGLFPVFVAVNALRYPLFDFMLDMNMSLLDAVFFPLVALCSVAAYFLALWVLAREKRQVSRFLLSNSTVFVPFAALLLWMIANVFLVHGVTQQTLYGYQLRHESFLLTLEYYLSFLMLGVFLCKPRWKLWLLRGLTAVSVLLIPCAFYLRDHWKIAYSDSLNCIWANSNYYGYFLTVFVGLSAALLAGSKSWGWRVFYAAALVLNSVTLCLNDTFGAWIGSFCACVFVVTAYKLRDGRCNRWALAALGLFLLSMLVTGTISGALSVNLLQFVHDVQLLLEEPESSKAEMAGSGRWCIWRNCIELIRQNPLFGVGFEGLLTRGATFFGRNVRPHNEYMQYALFFGIPGGILYTLGCAGVYVRAWKYRTRLDNITLAALAAAFGYLCGAFFGVTVYNTAPYLFIMLGLGYVHADSAE